MPRKSEDQPEIRPDIKPNTKRNIKKVNKPNIKEVIAFFYEAMRDGELDPKSRLRAAELLGKKLETIEHGIGQAQSQKKPDQLVIRIEYAQPNQHDSAPAAPQISKEGDALES